MTKECSIVKGISFFLSLIGIASIAMAAIGMEIMNYGLNCMNLGAGGWQQIIFGAFVLGFYTFSAQSGKITAFFEKRKRKAEQV